MSSIPTETHSFIHSFIQQELTEPQLRAQHCTRQRQIRHNPCRHGLMEKAATDKGKSTWRGTCADRSAPVRRPCPAPPSHPIPLATSQSGIHPTLSLPFSPDPNISPYSSQDSKPLSPLQLLGLQLLLGPPAPETRPGPTWFLAPAGAERFFSDRLPGSLFCRTPLGHASSWESDVILESNIPTLNFRHCFFLLFR